MDQAISKADLDQAVRGEVIDGRRLAASAKLDPARRSELGQFMTPSVVASFMAEFFGKPPRQVRLLDPGAGIGSLTAAVVADISRRGAPGGAIEADLFEVDRSLGADLETSVRQCGEAARRSGMKFLARPHNQDFIQAAVDMLRPGLFGVRDRPGFNRVVMNPPYRKIHSNSVERSLLRSVGIETSNLYTAFLALAVLLLEPRGELVAITPRSFCNGPYFRAFRQLFFKEMALTRLHVFDSRKMAFSDDDVLQENIIFKAVKNANRGRVFLSHSHGPGDKVVGRRVNHSTVVWPDDNELIVHLTMTAEDAAIADKLKSLPCSLADLDLEVSTGRVVEFRAKPQLLKQPKKGALPLIYPAHFDAGGIVWPVDGRKPNAILNNDETAALLVPSGYYTLTKRFSSKEERRRIVAAVFDPEIVKAEQIGFENHLNYFHRNGRGMEKELARGLGCYLNSTPVDMYFRQFSGHTQVNAADLRRLRYPSEQQLRALASAVVGPITDQAAVDTAMAQIVG